MDIDKYCFKTRIANILAELADMSKEERDSILGLRRVTDYNNTLKVFPTVDFNVFAVSENRN